MQNIKTLVVMAGVALITLSNPSFAVTEPVPVSEDGTIIYFPEVNDADKPGSDTHNWVVDTVTGEAIDCLKDPPGCRNLLNRAEDRKKPKSGGTTPPTTGGTPPTTGGGTPPTTSGTPPTTGGATPTGDTPKTGGGTTTAGGGGATTGGGSTSGGSTTSGGSESSSSNKRTAAPATEDGTSKPRLKGSQKPNRTTH